MRSFQEIHLGTVDYEAELPLREKVLRAPLGLSFTEQELADEPYCIHLGGFEGDQLVGVLLLKPLDAGTVKMRQVAVSPGLQRSGIGSALVAFAEAFARAKGFSRIVAHARCTAANFYLRNGYEVSGETFMETTIPHIFVSKEL